MYDYQKFLSDSSDDYPKYADGVVVQDPVQEIKYLDESPRWNSSIAHCKTDAHLDQLIDSFAAFKKAATEFFNENEVAFPSSGRVLTKNEKAYQLRETLKFGINTIKRAERKLNTV
tara:strand:- start:8060 stop:8407 length:348 start_codon:yes stop_codon:yes gene_type:complete